MFLLLLSACFPPTPTASEIHKEVVENLESLKTAEVAYYANTGHYVAISDEKEAMMYQQTGKHPKPTQDSAGLKKMGWKPTNSAGYSAYWAEISPEGLTIHGICDGDNDGELAHYTITEKTSPTLISPPGEL